MAALRKQHLLSGLIGGLTAAFIASLWPSFRDLAGAAVAVGDQAPAFRLMSENGQPTQLADFRGKFLILNFWATWCPPCVQEIPSLNQFHKKWSSRGVVVLGVSVDRDLEVYQKFLQKAQVQFLSVRDPERKVSRLYGTFKYPESYFIDPQGKVVHKIIGPADWTDPKMFDYLEQLLRG